MDNHFEKGAVLGQAANVLDRSGEQVTWDDGRSPAEVVLQHPFFCEPAIRTRPIFESYVLCRDRMLSGVEGFVVLGERGSGRRVALKVIHSYFSQEFPDLTAIEYLVPKCSSESPNVVLADLLASGGLRVIGGTRTAQFQRLMNMLEERVLVSGIRRCIIFLYNAENISQVECQILLDIRDGLLFRGIRLFVASSALVGEFRSKVSILKEKIGGESLRSIFGSGYSIRPLEGAQDYAGIMSEIDTLIISDSGSITWTQEMLPIAYSNGFRLISQADPLHIAVTSRVKAGRISARSLFGVIRQVLAKAIGDDSLEFAIPAGTWRDAVNVVLDVGVAYLPCPYLLVKKPDDGVSNE